MAVLRMPWLYFAMKPDRSEEEMRQFRTKAGTGLQKLVQVEGGNRVSVKNCSILRLRWLDPGNHRLIRKPGIQKWLFLIKQRLCRPFCIFHQKCIKFPIPKDQHVWIRLPRLDPKLLVFK